MKLTIEIELRGSVWSWNQVVDAVRTTAGTLSDSDENLEVGEKGFIFDPDAQDVGQFIVREGSVSDFHSLNEPYFDPSDNGNQGS